MGVRSPAGVKPKPLLEPLDRGCVFLTIDEDGGKLVERSYVRLEVHHAFEALHRAIEIEEVGLGHARRAHPEPGRQTVAIEILDLLGLRAEQVRQVLELLLLLQTLNQRIDGRLVVRTLGEVCRGVSESPRPRP